MTLRTGAGSTTGPPSITFHIGPGKTGSTTVQAALAVAAAAAGPDRLCLPSPGFGPNGHMAAAFNLLGCNDELTIPINARHFLRTIGKACDKAWDALVDKALSGSAPVIISQELLACLNPAGVRTVAETFDGIPLRAVAMYRPPSRLLPSLYQQEAQMMLVPAFERYAHRCVALLLGGGEHEYVWLDSSWLSRTWTEAGIPLEVVPAVPDLSPAAFEALLSSLLPAGVAVPAIEHRNEGLSAYGVDLWRDHLQATWPAHLLPAIRVLETFRTVDPWACDTALGGTYRLRPDVAAALDRAFGWESDDGDAGRARAELAEALASQRPLTVRTPGVGPGEQQRRAAVLVQLGRRQRQDSLLWAAAAVVRRLQRRPSPMRADWTFTDT